jgi:flagellin protein
VTLIQNRLEYTVKVDDNTSENLQSAESRIRDTDMADDDDKILEREHLAAGSYLHACSGRG